MATQLEILRRLEEQRKARERMQSAINVPVGGLSATPYIMDSFKRSGGWPGQAVDPLFVNNPNTVRVEAESPSFIDTVTGFLFDSAKPTILPSNDPRIRAQKEAELQTQRIESGDIPSLGDILIPNQEERLKQVDIARNFREYGNIPDEDSIRDSILVSPATEETVLSDISSIPSTKSTTSENLGVGTSPENLGVGTPTPREDIIKPELTSPPKEQVWGKYAKDPAARKKKYLDEMNKIYRNAMILNAIAAFTGGQSQANAYIKMATGKMDAIDKFDQEERLHNIWKNTFFSDGEFDKPLSYQEAYDRAIRLGATPKEAQEIAQTAYNKPSATTGTSIGQTEQARYITVARESDNYTPEQIQDITNIVSKPNAVSVLQRKYPDLVDEYIKRKEQTSRNFGAGLMGLTQPQGGGQNALVTVNGKSVGGAVE